MDNLNKILDIVSRTGKELIVSKENGECFVISKFSDYDKTSQKVLDFSQVKDDDYTDLVRKTIMP